MAARAEKRFHPVQPGSCEDTGSTKAERGRERVRDRKTDRERGRDRKIERESQR